MELIDRYVEEVAQYLPEDSDIPDELRSLLCDALEQRAAKADRPADKTMAVTLLREFGEPEEVAFRYEESNDDEPQCLIGPYLYPEYEAWMIGVVTIPGIAALIGKALRLIFQGAVPALASIPPALWGYTKYAFIAAAVTTLVFALLERTIGYGGDEKWDPRELLTS